MNKYKTGLIWVLTGIYLLIIAVLLTLAIDQAYLLVSLYRISAAPGPVTDFSGLGQLSFSSDLLIVAIAASILLLLVWRRLRRLLPITMIAILIFVALNLYSGRHVLPQLLIWPAPSSLSKQYVQALAANDLEAALHLTDESEVCETIMKQAFQKHQAQLKRRTNSAGLETNIQDISGKSFTTFYDKPVPQGFVLLQPVPSQLVTVMAEMENGQTIWLNLKMRYTPFWGTRYICGEDIDVGKGAI